MPVDYEFVKNQKKKKGKKIFLIILVSIIIGILSFGTGILIAEIQLRVTKTDSQNISVEPPLEQTMQEEPASPPNADQEPQVEQKEETAVEESAESDAVKFSFAIIGDTQRFDAGNSNGGIQQSVRNIAKIGPGLVFAVGDLVSSCDGKSGCEGKINSWKNILGALMPKTYPAMGNHDRTGKGKADELWQKLFALPANGPPGFSELAYSLDFENSHFVVLNSEKPEEHVINKTQRDWLEGNLAANKKDNTFIFFHEPAYPVSSKIDESLDAESGDRDALWNILVRHKVTAVFSGHEHIHSRRQVGGIYQFVFGNTDSYDHDMPKAGMAEYAYQGNSFGIVEVNDREITVKVFSASGSLLNSFTFKK